MLRVRARLADAKVKDIVRVLESLEASHRTSHQQPTLPPTSNPRVTSCTFLSPSCQAVRKRQRRIDVKTRITLYTWSGMARLAQRIERIEREVRDGAPAVKLRSGDGEADAQDKQAGVRDSHQHGNRWSVPSEEAGNADQP